MPRKPEGMSRAQLEALCRRQQAQIGALEAELQRERNAHAVTRSENARLREEVALLREEVRQLRAELAQEREAHRLAREHLADVIRAIERMDERAKVWLRRQYHTSSERMVVEAGQCFITEVLEQVRDEHGELIADVAASADQPVTSPTEGDGSKQSGLSGQGGKRKRPSTAGGRNPLPAELPREEITYQPPDDHPLFVLATSRKQIGTTTIERVDITPVRVVVQAMTCPVYTLQLPGGGRTQQTMAPPGIIERGQVSDRFLVTSAVDKVQDHLPAYRQQTRFARAGAEILRSKLCRWHMHLAAFLQPVADAILDEIRAAPSVGIDDSVHRLVVPDRHVCKHGRLIAVGAQPGIFYQFQETREATWFSRLLADYSGPVMGDAYSGHNPLLARDDIIALFCWAHARRKFFECSDKRRRGIVLEHIARLYAVEDDIHALPPDQRARERRQRAGPILAQIHELLTSWQASRAVLPKTGIGEATSYVLKRWNGFTAYLNHGYADIDNNRIERGMRPNAMHRKNSLFSASVRGAQSYATLLTLTQSAWLHNLDPHAYLLDVIDHIHHRRWPVEQLTPIAYASSKKCLVGKPS